MRHRERRLFMWSPRQVNRQSQRERYEAEGRAGCLHSRKERGSRNIQIFHTMERPKASVRIVSDRFPFGSCPSYIPPYHGCPPLLRNAHTAKAGSDQFGVEMLDDGPYCL